MEKKLIIANWKSNKNTVEVHEFFTVFSERILELNLENKELVIAPSFQLLSLCKELIQLHALPIKLSAQNISAFGVGPFTGEISAFQVREFCDMTIIGHSERRDLLSEHNETLQKKAQEARSNNLEVVYCVQNEAQIIPEGVQCVAYEPPTAIGSGTPAEPDHVEAVFGDIQKKFSGKILYGGSVKPENVRDYIHIASCNGLLIGGASLDANTLGDLLLQW